MLRSTVAWCELVWNWRWISSRLADHLKAIGKRPPFASVEQKQSAWKRPSNSRRATSERASGFGLRNWQLKCPLLGRLLTVPFYEPCHWR